MKKFLLVLVGLIAVVIGAAIIVPFVVPTETYKQQLAKQVEKATGRALTIDGPLDVTILPTLAVEMTEVRFANAPGSADPDMMRLEGLQAELKIWPLLRGAVEVDRFVLVEPEIHLEVDQQGRPNWQFGEATGDAPSDASGTGDAEPTSLPLTEVKLGDIRLENGVLTYADATTGTSERIEAINMSLELPDIRSPFQAHGSLAYKGETIELELAVQSLLDLIQEGSSPVAVGVDSDRVRLGFDGTLSNAGEPSANGAVELDVPSIRELAAWLAEPIEFEGEGLQTLEIAGRLDASAKRIAFADATLGLDAIEGTGELVADLSGAVPKVSGRLDLGAVDLNPYLPPESEPEPAPSGTAAPAPSGDQSGTSSAPSDWSDEPIQLLPLGGADVDFELTLEALQARELKLDRTVLALRLAGAALHAELKEFALYGGHGSGQLNVTVADGTPTIQKRFRLEGLQALPFFTDAAKFERLEGTVNAEFALSTRGQTQRQLVENLSGDGRATFVDGAIVGVNVAAMVRNVAGAFLDTTAAEARKTDFAELSGSFKIQNGLLRNDDLTLRAPTLRIAGAGTLDLPQRRVDYRLEPTAAATLEGQGSEQEVAGLLVPVVVSGPWHELSYTPDLSGVIESALRDPEALKEQIEQLGGNADQVKDALKQVDEEDAKELIEGLAGALAGGNQGGAAGKTESDTPDAAQQLLKQLFKN